MWDFEHPPRNTALAAYYDVHYTQPSLCADDLLSDRVTPHIDPRYAQHRWAEAIDEPYKGLLVAAPQRVDLARLVPQSIVELR